LIRKEIETATDDRVSVWTRRYEGRQYVYLEVDEVGADKAVAWLQFADVLELIRHLSMGLQDVMADGGLE